MDATQSEQARVKPPVPTTVFAPLVASRRARGRRRRRQLQEERAKGTWRLIGLVLIALGVVAVVVGISAAAGAYVRFRGAEILASLIVSGVLLGIISALLLSALGHAVQAFFSAKDLWFWNASPASAVAFFLDRTIETMTAALPAVLSLGALALGAFVVAAGLGGWVLLRSELALLLVAVMPVMVGIAGAHVGGAILPAGQLRRASLLLLTLASAGFLLWVRAARIERVVTEEGAQELLRSAEGLAHVGPWWLPSSLGAGFAVDGNVSFGGLLFAASAAMVAIAYASHRRLYAMARDRASDDAPMGLAPTSLRRRWLKWIAARISRPITAGLVERDLLVFVRDPAQWSQLILLLGIGLVYLINAAALVEGFGGFGLVSDVVLGTLHTGLVCFISAGLAARFGFPAVAAEGPAYWFIDGAPLTMRDYLDAKWRASIPVVAGYPMIIGAAGGLALGLSLTSWLISMGIIVVTTLSLAAFAVGRGARAPAFDATNLSELAMGPGALSTMTLAVTASGIMALAFTCITGGLVALQEWTSLGVSSYALLLVSLPVGGVAWWAGQRSLTSGANARDASRAEPTLLEH